MRCYSLCNVLVLIASALHNVAKVDFATARNHIRQFKEISQPSEEALALLNTMHDGYRSMIEAQLPASCMLAPFVMCLFHEYSPFVFRPNVESLKSL